MWYSRIALAVTVTWFCLVGCAACSSIKATPISKNRKKEALPTASQVKSRAPSNSQTDQADFREEWSFPEADNYRIDGKVVSRKEFEALRAQLEIGKAPEMTGELENPDGSYGGHEANYRAVHRSTGAEYTFIEVTFSQDGSTSTLHSIRPR